MTPNSVAIELTVVFSPLVKKNLMYTRRKDNVNVFLVGDALANQLQACVTH